MPGAGRTALPNVDRHPQEAMRRATICTDKLFEAGDLNKSYCQKLVTRVSGGAFD